MVLRFPIQRRTRSSQFAESFQVYSFQTTAPLRPAHHLEKALQDWLEQQPAHVSSSFLAGNSFSLHLYLRLAVLLYGDGSARTPSANQRVSVKLAEYFPCKVCSSAVDRHQIAQSTTRTSSASDDADLDRGGASMERSTSRPRLAVAAMSASGRSVLFAPGLRRNMSSSG